MLEFNLLLSLLLWSAFVVVAVIVYIMWVGWMYCRWVSILYS